MRPAYILSDKIDIDACDHTFTGQVSPGTGQGKKFGFPTANLLVESFHIQCAAWSGTVELSSDNGGMTYAAVIYVTAGGFNKFKIQIHILDFAGLLYGKDLKFKVHKRIRPIITFESSSSEVEQIERDVISTREWWSKYLQESQTNAPASDSKILDVINA